MKLRMGNISNVKVRIHLKTCSGNVNICLCVPEEEEVEEIIAINKV